MRITFPATVALLLTSTVISSTRIQYEDYGFSSSYIQSFYEFSADHTSLVVHENSYQPMQLAKALSWMAINGNYDLPLFDMDTGAVPVITYQLPQPSFFILAWMFVPFPAAPGTTYMNNPAYGSANWPPVFGQAFLNKAGIFDLLSRVTIQARAADGSETLLTGTWPYTNLYYFPLEAQDLFLNRISQAFESLDLLENWSTEHLNLFEAHFASFQSLFDGVSYPEIIFDDQYQFIDENQDVDDMFVPEYQGDITEVKLEAGDVLYAETDETFQLWLSEDRKAAYVVDAGSLFLSQGLKKLIKGHGQVKDIYITVTHFHPEHMQTLISLIHERQHARVHIYMVEDLSLAFSAWYVTYLPILTPLLKHGDLTIELVKKDTWATFGDNELYFAWTWDYEDSFLHHFVPNTTPIVKDCQGRYRIVGGDIQDWYQSGTTTAYSNEEILEKLSGWVAETFERVGIQAGDQVDFYFYIGLFYINVYFYEWQDEHIDSYMQPEEVITYLKEQFPEVRLDIIQAHIKDTGCSLDLHKSFSV